MKKLKAASIGRYPVLAKGPDTLELTEKFLAKRDGIDKVIIAFLFDLGHLSLHTPVLCIATVHSQSLRHYSGVLA